MRAVSGIILGLLLVGVLTSAVCVQPVKSDYVWTETIYIKADGSIQPLEAPISSVDNVTYTLTDNIMGNVTVSSSAIIIQRDNVTVDGTGHMLQGANAQNSSGIELVGRNNVTIKNMRIRAFIDGIYLDSSFDDCVSGNTIKDNSVDIWFQSSSNNDVSENDITATSGVGIYLYSSSNNSVSGNNLVNNVDGIWLDSSSNNNVSGNTVKDNSAGIWFHSSFNNSVGGNNITNNAAGIDFHYSSDNSVSGNNMANNVYGVESFSSYNNTVYHNNFVSNNGVVYVFVYSYESTNVWDNGCEGNYWSDYNGTDSNHDGVGDTPYAMDANNTDNFPLMNVYWSPCNINHDLKVDMKDIGRAARAFNTVPGDALWNPHADITGPQYLVPDNKVDTRDIDFIVRQFGAHYP